MCILFVEDEPIITMVACDALSEAGHDVVPASSGQEAIELLAAEPDRFTCIVTDFNMPGCVTGADVIRHARTVAPTTPIVLATALGGSVTLAWLAEFGVTLLPKPYSLDGLVQMVEQLLTRA